MLVWLPQMHRFLCEPTGLAEFKPNIKCLRHPSCAEPAEVSE
jgi:hypothetical protein